MILTRTWAVILSVLATGCLAGMLLLSLGSGSDFSDAEREAVRAVTEAGVTALEAEIKTSPVYKARGVEDDERLSEALARSPQQEDNLPDDAVPLAQVVLELAEKQRLRTESELTLAVIEASGAVRAANGRAEPHLGELVASQAYQNLSTTDETMFSVILDGKISVARCSKPDAKGRRVVTVVALKIGADSLLRRILGTSTPAGLVRKGELLGKVFGDVAVEGEVEALADAHEADAPETGASRVFVVGEGLDARVGALGRVPGPAGQGRNGAMLVVLSRKTAAASQRDLAEALRQAKEKGLLGRINWVLLAGLLLVSIALALYLPQLEALGPTRRLGREFELMAQGGQHQLFHDRYSGATGEVARAAAAAHDVMRQAFLAELEIGEVDEDHATAPRPRPRTGRRRLTRSGRKVESSKSRRAASGAATAPADAAEGTTPADDVAAAEAAAARAASEALGSAPQPVAATGTPVTPAPNPATAPPLSAPLGTPSMGASPAGLSALAGRPPSGPNVGIPAPPLPSAPPQTPKPTPNPSSTPIPALGLAGPSSPRTGQTAPPIAAPGDSKDAYYQEIYEEFIQVKMACGEPTAALSFDKFSAKLRKNASDLMKKRPGVTDVQFTVYVKDGKAALKAKVVKG